MALQWQLRGQSRLSKYGNARLRRTLWTAGQTAVLKRTNSFRDKFERYISKDRHNAHLRRKAYTAIAATLSWFAGKPLPGSGWRAPYTPSSKTAHPIAPSSRG